MWKIGKTSTNIKAPQGAGHISELSYLSRKLHNSCSSSTETINYQQQPAGILADFKFGLLTTHCILKTLKLTLHMYMQN